MDPRAHDPHPREGARRRPARAGAPPTVRQVYALAAALCAKDGIDFPPTRDAASALIERLREQIGHPRPRLRDPARAASATPANDV